MLVILSLASRSGPLCIAIAQALLASYGRQEASTSIWWEQTSHCIPEFTLPTVVLFAPGINLTFLNADAIDEGHNKEALQLANKILKKTPDYSLVKVLPFARIVSFIRTS